MRILTPFLLDASNVFFKEDIRWDCDDAKPMAYAKVFSTDRVPSETTFQRVACGFPG